MSQSIPVLVHIAGTSQRCETAPNHGSDAILMVVGLPGTDDAGLEEVELSSAVHLALHELELGDLALGLAVSTMAR